jgi:UDP-N-acetylmuramate dehydrogenase
LSWRDRLPPVRGRLERDAPLAPYTWLRVGGAADALFLPADEEDLAVFLSALDRAVPVMVLGVGSNLLVRDGGVEGVVVRLGRPFAELKVEGETLIAGAGALDAQAARRAAEAGLAGLEFMTGVPGAVGGGLVMNAGCYGREFKDVVLEAEGLDRDGRMVRFTGAQMGFSYRRAEAAHGVVFLRARLQGRTDDPVAVAARMAEITAARERAQPIREKTGGSTFKNPKGPDGAPLSAWRLIDAAGWRGRGVGGALMSEKHANFLINAGEARAADVEALGEAVRADVLRTSGIALEWEIRRVGRPLV